MLDNHIPPPVDVTDVCVKTLSRTILSNVSFQIEKPGFIAILGESGVGKSTLLSVLAGIVPTFSGAIALSSPVSLMTQKDTLLAWKNVIDNVTLGYQLRGQYGNAILHRGLDLLDSVGIKSYAHAYPDTLSGGQRQRVMLARTLLEDTSIVLMDEPFSALDAISRHKIGLLAQKLLKDRTTIMITHDPLEALRLADQIFLMTSPTKPLIPIDMPTSPAPREDNLEEVIDRYHTILQRLIA